MALALQYQSGLPQARDRIVQLHLLKGEPKASEFAATVYMYENDAFSFEGVLEALRLHDPRVPRNAMPKLRTGEIPFGVAVHADTWVYICRSDQGWRTAWNRLLERGGTAPEAFVYFVRCE